MKPYPYQEQAVQSVFDYFASNNGNPLVAMPTGTGKSVVIGSLVHRVMNWQPSHRFIMATHVKELVEQNAKRLEQIYPGAPYGIYSAGLKSRDYMQPIIYGGIASMCKNPQLFGWRDTLIVDEAHLIGKNDETQYKEFIHALRLRNPWLKVIGFTATPYRVGMGYLTNGGIFTDFAFDNTRMKEFNELIAAGYLSLLVTKKTHAEVDIRGVHTSSTGDFVLHEIEERVTAITEAAIQETLLYASNRVSWLVFASSVDHAELVAERYRQLGARAIAVHGGTKKHPLADKERDDRINAFKRGEYQIVVNYNVLTTGFDHPPIDLIVMFRATKSVPLWVQMLGRGTRPFEGDNYFPRKSNCLVLDFAGNTKRLGPINDPCIPLPKGQGAGEAPVKICEECGTYNHISVRFCIGCGAEFEIKEKTETKASSLEVIRDITPVFEEFVIATCHYGRHKSKKSGLDSFEAIHYTTGGREFRQYISIEGQGRAREKAVQWWSQRSPEHCPSTIEDALIRVSELRVPTRILVQTNASWPEIERCFYD